MPVDTLTAVRDQVKAVIESHTQVVEAAKNVLSAIESELARVPSMTDVKELLERAIAATPQA